MPTTHNANQRNNFFAPPPPREARGRRPFCLPVSIFRTYSRLRPAERRNFPIWADYIVLRFAELSSPAKAAEFQGLAKAGGKNPDGKERNFIRAVTVA
jgi:hypothetical protein